MTRATDDNAADAMHADMDAPQILEDGPTLPALLTDDFVGGIEKSVTNYQRFTTAMYRLTRPTHWVNHGTADRPKYSLQGPGAEALMNPLGISYERPTFRREDQRDEHGEFYLYWCEGFVESRTLGRKGWYLGYCDSRDQFFNKRPGWHPKTGEGDVKKSAMTNWIVNAVSRIAGIRDPDPQLLANAGLNPRDIGTIDYSGNRSEQVASDVISEAQRKRLWAIFKKSGASEEQLKTGLKEQWKIDSTNDIKRRDYESVCAWVEAGCKPKAPAAKSENGAATVDRSKPCAVCQLPADAHANADHEFES